MHLAGINRTNNQQLFQDVNVKLTESICTILIKNSLKIPVFLHLQPKFQNLTNMVKVNSKVKKFLEN